VEFRSRRAPRSTSRTTAGSPCSRPTEVELDRIYLGKVKKIVEFGAFVEVIPNTEGLLHISQIAENRIRSVQDVLTEGDEVLVKVIEIDGNGKMRLSRKIALREQPALADKEKLKNPDAANPPRA